MELQKPFNEHTYDFQVLNPDDSIPQRQIVSPLSPLQLAEVKICGYALLRRFVNKQLVEAFQAIVDAACSAKYGDSLKDTYSSGRFGGQFIRDLHATSAEAWTYLNHTRIPDLVRSMLGPRIVLRSYSARVTHPGSGSSTIWHCDQRARAIPLQPWAVDAPSITVIVYLDRADEGSGKTELVPASHTRWNLPNEKFLEAEDHASVVSVSGEPGDVLLFHGAIWHRGGATETSLRRILNLQFAPSWARRSNFEAVGENPAWNLIADKARKQEKQDELELLGLGGYM